MKFSSLKGANTSERDSFVSRWSRGSSRRIAQSFLTNASDSFVFALLFVAAVGLGPFAGVIGICNTWSELTPCNGSL